jgi:hypothetical protein
MEFDLANHDNKETQSSMLLLYTNKRIAKGDWNLEGSLSLPQSMHGDDPTQNAWVW